MYEDKNTIVLVVARGKEVGVWRGFLRRSPRKPMKASVLPVYIRLHSISSHLSMTLPCLNCFIHTKHFPLATSFQHCTIQMNLDHSKQAQNQKLPFARGSPPTESSHFRPLARVQKLSIFALFNASLAAASVSHTRLPHFRNARAFCSPSQTSRQLFWLKSFSSPF